MYLCIRERIIARLTVLMPNRALFLPRFLRNRCALPTLWGPAVPRPPRSLPPWARSAPASAWLPSLLPVHGVVLASCTLRSLRWSVARELTRFFGRLATLYTSRANTVPRQHGHYLPLCAVLALKTGVFQIYSNDPHILELCQSVALLFCIAFATESCEVCDYHVSFKWHAHKAACRATSLEPNLALPVADVCR